MNGFRCSCGHTEYYNTPWGEACSRCGLELDNVDLYNIQQYRY